MKKPPAWTTKNGTHPSLVGAATPTSKSKSAAADTLGTIDGQVIRSGDFSIANWANYPAGVPKPAGPVNLISGAEYEANRAAANAANRAIHRADPTISPQQIHEVQPVKFSGNPTDAGNKVYLDPLRQHSPKCSQALGEDTCRPVTCTAYTTLGDVKEIWAGSTTDTTSKTCTLDGVAIQRQLSRTYGLRYGSRAEAEAGRPVRLHRAFLQPQAPAA